MARGPFQGTYQPNARPTVVTAPDTLVFFNGETDLVGCNECRRSFDVNKYITSVTIDLNIDSPPGSASISLSVPRHTIDDFYFEGKPILCPMMEVEIFSKGYYLVEGVPQYYPVFWGIITEVADSYADGVHSVSISCSDILKWWELTYININPAYLAPNPRMGRSISGNVFSQANPYDIILTLASQSFGDIITATGSMKSLIREGSERQAFDTALTDIMVYWEQRFSRMRRNLVMFGVNGAAIRGDTLFQEYVAATGSTNITPNMRIASTAISRANGGPNSGQAGFDPSSPDVIAFKQDISSLGNIDLWQSEYQTKLELAIAAKESIGFEFYMDVTGDIVFKPPFFNLDVLGNKPVSWIQDIDIISWDFRESETDVITHITLTGSWASTVNYNLNAEILPATSVVDYHLLRRYGWRTTTYNSEFLTTQELIFYHGLDLLDRINSKRHTATVVIPLRPELRMGFPIYIAPQDQIWYIQGISHNISFGGRATTSLNLTSRREKFIAPRGVGKLKLEDYSGKHVENADGVASAFKYSSRQLAANGVFSLDVSNAATLPNLEENSDTDRNLQEPLLLRHPKTGRIVGYPNVVMAFTRKFLSDDISREAGMGDVHRPSIHESKINQEKSLANRQAYQDYLAKTFSYNKYNALHDRYMSNRYQYGLNSAGVFVYAHDVSSGGGVVSEALVLPHGHLNVTPKEEGSDDATGSVLIRPISDERGFEVIGHYRYGRRIYLKDGKLIASDPGRAKVELQLALTGGLSETLAAQSQGLTSITTGYQSMAEQLSTLTPQDTDTAITPNRKSENIFDTGEKFVDTAVLGSFEQKGVLGVEATQLSMALTLNEMSVRQATAFGGEECSCLMGRQDLAFLGGDYQVRTLTGDATEDVPGLYTDSLDDIGIKGGSVTQALFEVNRIELDVGKLQLDLEAATKAAKNKPELTQIAADLQAQLTKAQTELILAQANLKDLQSKPEANGSIFTKTNAEVISRVEQFLITLYQSLDEAHQEFESAIRGDLLPQAPVETSLNGEQINPQSEFAPPFSATDRYQLGDPKAAIEGIQSNAKGVTQAFRTIGNNLRKSADTTALTTKISQDSASVNRLTAVKNQLETQKAASDVVVGFNLDKQIATVTAEIDKLNQSIADNQLKLSTL